MANAVNSGGFTPYAVRQQWAACKIRVETFFERNLQSSLFRCTIIFLLIGINGYLCLSPQIVPPPFHFVYLSTFQAFFLALCIWGPAGLLLQTEKLKVRREFILFGLLIVHILLMVSWFGYRAPFADKILQMLVMFMQLAMLYFLCMICASWPAWTAWITSLTIAAISYWVFSLAEPISSIAWISTRANPTRFLMFLTFFALQFQYLRARLVNREQKLSYIFNPLQTLYPLPLPVESVQMPPTKRLYAQGLMNISFATVALISFLLISSMKLPAKGWYAPVIGYNHHFFYLFYLIAFGVGLLQWCGFVLPQPCDFALLSASPHMRWRRWNRYTYKWLSLAVYFPLLKIVRSRLLALLAAFFVVALLHLNAVFTMPGTNVLAADLRSYLLKHFAYYLGHAAAIWLGFFVPSSWTDERKVSSWLGVLLTWVLVTCIFGVYY